jgi:chitin disaccharide deacetylase
VTRLCNGPIRPHCRSNGFHRLANRYGVRVNPAFAGTYGFAKDADYTEIFPKFLRGLPDGSVVMCHPGFVDAELQRLDSPPCASANTFF